jgi:hypothetical protein
MVDDKEELMIACREQIMTISETWNLLSEEDKTAYNKWHTEHIPALGLKAKLIGIIASPEAKKILLRHMSCPICQGEGIPFHGSSQKTFQEHCRRKNNVEFTRSVDPLILNLSHIIGKDIGMKICSASGGEKLLGMPVPVCYHPGCVVATTDSRTVKHHMELDHRTGSPELVMRDLLIAHIRSKTESDATIEDLLGRHDVFTCSACPYTSEVKGGAKRHLRHCKKIRPNGD